MTCSRSSSALISATLALVACATIAEAAPTRVTVRAVSRDAKVIGDGVGGARITIRDVESKKVLASGIQTGGTGDTSRIIQEPRKRGAVVYGTEGAAAFRTTLDITRPTVVEITAEGPLKYPQATQRVSRTMLLLPARHIEGEGVLLEIAGFIVDVPKAITAKAAQPLPLRAKITMTCGCPTEPGGLWNADEITVAARVLRGEKVVKEMPLTYAGEVSTYAATLPALPPGTYTVELTASDVRSGNFGRATTVVTVTQSAAR